jgi:Uma2 family endonuclease
MGTQPATASPLVDRCVLFIPRAAIWTPADTYLEPDLFLVEAERLKTMDAGELRTADLVVEILTAGSAMYDRTAKADTYAALGVRELWLVDLERRAVEQRILSGAAWATAGTHAGSAGFESVVFPGLTLVPADLFP